ncbi:MAG: hypothetical protein Ct9H300mP21_11070 [Pseudomonadota bacterium]|nr:MAG: hypothetical protein Ct9H300mP21_11070 [Pseudomonadota bacterium]
MVKKKNNSVIITFLDLIQMSYVVHVTAVVEGDLDQIEILIKITVANVWKTRLEGKQFFACRSVEQKNVFLYTRYLQIRQPQSASRRGGS